MLKEHFKNMSRPIVCKLMCAAFVFSTAGMVSGAEVIDRIVAVVNSDIIVLTDLNRELKPAVAQIKAQNLPEDQEKEELSKYREVMLNQLINQALIDQEIKRYGISVSDEEVDQSITRIRESKFLTEERFEEELKKNMGLSMDEYREKSKDQLLRMKLINSQVQSKVVITDKDREQYYEQFEEEFAGGKRYHLRNIIMRVSSDTSEAEKEKIEKKMEKVFEELKQGAAFAAVADKYSESSTNGEGGDLGFFRFNDLSPQLKEVLADKSEGEFTSVLDTELGYQILYVEKIEDDTGKSLEEASPEIDKQIYNASVNIKFQSWLMELRKQSHIKIIE
ncbi:MAG: SurA N-terminal domain-containing protein [Deltaproteobacteria bacterium]|nr:SurA N-terminal domain-containing protein [Deltaproteobacteria bacterium]